MCGNSDDKTWMLISLKLAAEADEAALKELEELINTSRLSEDCYQVLESWWNAKPKKNAQVFDHFFEELLKKLRQRIKLVFEKID